ncbi:MAG TPA: hypothetical protein VK742_19910 [Candidatus Sulfotelmatobacter sp.]|jgi:hypothetical protein|nr:hypothetical protein [Candidatus Sulfotelmatobacter sp.]
MHGGKFFHGSRDEEALTFNPVAIENNRSVLEIAPTYGWDPGSRKCQSHYQERKEMLAKRTPPMILFSSKNERTANQAVKHMRSAGLLG